LKQKKITERGVVKKRLRTTGLKCFAGKGYFV